MDEEKIDISVIQCFRSGVSVDKKSKKKVLAIFKYLTGKESPIEAVELTVRRDQNLREAQLKIHVRDGQTRRRSADFGKKRMLFPLLVLLFSLLFENFGRSYTKIGPGRLG